MKKILATLHCSYNEQPKSWGSIFSANIFKEGFLLR